MNEEILINVTPQETRVAIVQQGAVQELHLERTLSRFVMSAIAAEPPSCHQGPEEFRKDLVVAGRQESAFSTEADEARPTAMLTGKRLPPCPLA